MPVKQVGGADNPAVPVMVGKGIGFIGETLGLEWKLSESVVLDGGIVRSTYLFDGHL